MDSVLAPRLAQDDAQEKTQDIIIDEEFRSLLPALDSETFKQLEENLLQNGCRDPIVLWNGMLIDGHNRYLICTEHDIAFFTTSMEFHSREEVLIWIIGNQIARRNLTPMQLSFFRGLHYRADKQIIRNKTGRNQFSEVNGQFDPKPPTAHRLAQRYHVAPKTIRRDARVADAIDAIGEISAQAKQKILSGEVPVNRMKLEALASGSALEIEAIADRIREGTYERRATVSPAQKAEPPPEAKLVPEDGFEQDDDKIEMHLKTVVWHLTYAYQSALHTIDEGGVAILKTTLRSYIESLEALYRSIYEGESP